MPTTDTYTPYTRRIDAKRRETWADWTPNIPATMPPTEFVEHVNSHLRNGHFTVEDLEMLEEGGILPDPGDPPLYPAPAWGLIAQVLAFNDTIPSNIETLGRNMATAIDRLAVIEARETRKGQQRETWEDWFPDAPFAVQGTMGELLTLVKAQHGERVTADNIRYWQKAGIIPSPVKRWHLGATRALYPLSLATVIIGELLDLKHQGYTLEQIGPRLRAWARAIHDPDPLGIADVVTNLAHETGRMNETTVARVEMRFVNTDGSDVTYHYDIPPDRTETT